MNLPYYEPMFYIASKEMPFTIRIEVILNHDIDPAALEFAARKALKRYPYFKIKTVLKDGCLIAEPNDAEPVIIGSAKPPVLFSRESNFLPLAFSYSGSEINFYISHIITDGGGFCPFVNTVLYYYLCAYTEKSLDGTGIRLSDDDFFADELGNPYPEEKMLNAEPFYLKKDKPFFRLRDGGFVADETKTVYRFELDEAEIMRFNFDNDGSPCALVSSLCARAIQSVHPENSLDIVSAVSFNLRPGLGNKYSYRMLCSNIDIRYPVRLLKEDISKICTCSRGTVTLASQPENVIYYARRMREMLEKVNSLRDAEVKKAVLGKMALEDSVNNTFSVSYVGKIRYGSLAPYIKSIYNLTDGSTYKSVFIEISSVNGKFNVAFIQGFSCDIYYRAFLKQLDLCGLSYNEKGAMPLGTPDVCLP